MRYIELLLYLKLKHQRNGNKYLLLAVGGPVKSAASKCRESGEKAANEEWYWRRAAPFGPGSEKQALPCGQITKDPSATAALLEGILGNPVQNQQLFFRRGIVCGSQNSAQVTAALLLLTVIPAFPPSRSPNPYKKSKALNYPHRKKYRIDCHCSFSMGGIIQDCQG